MKILAAIFAAIIFASCAARDAVHERALRELKPIKHENDASIFEELFRALEDLKKHDKAFAEKHIKALRALKNTKDF